VVETIYGMKFLKRAINLRRASDVEKICSFYCIEPSDFDKPVHRRHWEDWFDMSPDYDSQYDDDLSAN
jgi:hypothetical protein